MWYESKLINEIFDSIHNALEYYSNIDLTLKLCLNGQTYWESPKTGKTTDSFGEFLNHPLLKTINVEISKKDDAQEFYSVGDWRREQYNTKGFTVWGESDCILPRELFHTIDYIEQHKFQYPYFITLSHRKMWDDSWSIVEHPKLQNTKLQDFKTGDILRCDSYINQKQLDEFNSTYEFSINRIDRYKSDGALIIISKDMKLPFISPNLHCFGDDSCFLTFCNKFKIPNYHIDGLMKGHNTHHPLKRQNTVDKNTFEQYEKLKQQGYLEINKWININ
jgi:hypothetical protein